MKYYVVIDTNVLVSAMLKASSIPGCVITHALIGDIIPLLNEQVITEYIEVLNRAKFNFDIEQVRIVIDGLIRRGYFIDADNIDVELPDAKDAVFYQIVMEKRKNTDAFLVTGNIKHFPTESFIVTPKEMLTILESK